MRAENSYCGFQIRHLTFNPGIKHGLLKLCYDSCFMVCALPWGDLNLGNIASLKRTEPRHFVTRQYFTVLNILAPEPDNSINASLLPHRNTIIKNSLAFQHSLIRYLKHTHTYTHIIDCRKSAPIWHQYVYFQITDE